MTCPICPEPNGPSLASHEGPESVLAPSLRGASARLFVRRALPCSGPLRLPRLLTGLPAG